MQVPLSAASLNTNDCFVLVTKGETYVWMGKGSTGDERETAKTLASQSDRDPVVVYEGRQRQGMSGTMPPTSMIYRVWH